MNKEQISWIENNIEYVGVASIMSIVNSRGVSVQDILIGDISRHIEFMEQGNLPNSFVAHKYFNDSLHLQPFDEEGEFTEIKVNFYTVIQIVFKDGGRVKSTHYLNSSNVPYPEYEIMTADITTLEELFSDYENIEEEVMKHFFFKEPGKFNYNSSAAYLELK